MHRPACLEHIECADNVGVDIGAWVLQAVANARLGGEMDHDCRPAVAHDLLKRGGILEHELVAVKSWQLGQNGVSGPLQIHVVIVREAVYADNLVSLQQKGAGDVKADEARSAGDDDGRGNMSVRSHGVLSHQELNPAHITPHGARSRQS